MCRVREGTNLRELLSFGLKVMYFSLDVTFRNRPKYHLQLDNKKKSNPTYGH